MQYRILLVEDCQSIAEMIRSQAASWDLDVRLIQNFHAVMEEFDAFQPHLVLLDITLPFFNGYHWCSEIRKRSNVPILFLSSASDHMNMVMAMTMGADDFIAKPFDFQVLMAKIQAMLRRTYDFSTSMPVLEHRGAVLQTGEQCLRYQDQTIPLTRNEYRILLCLLEHKGQVVSREKLMQRLWETDLFVDENTLTVNINRLRKKLNDAGLVQFIDTKFGVGYWIARSET